MKNILISSWQLLTYFFVGIPLRLIFRVKRRVNYKFEKDKNYILAANHPGRIDPFLISYSFPFMDFLKLIPFRFVTADKYLKNPFLKPFLLLWGCFSTREHKQSVLSRAKKLLQKGETIFIFPGGEIEGEKKENMPKVGMVYLEREVINSKIIPVHINGTKNINLKNKVIINYKKQVRHKEFPEDLHPLANEVYTTIMKSNTIHQDDLFELPWKNTDNPNGWIEPTTFCQFKCPGCYRGLAENEVKREHESLESMKNQVEWFYKNRNTQTISIAGGEPLLYPQLEELIEYISKKNLKTKIYTNAVSLTKEKLLRLKKAGATEIIIHLDKFQRGLPSEQEVNQLREEYCNLFREVKGINLGFIMPISKQNVTDLKILAKFFQNNSDIVSLVVFTVYKEMLPGKVIEKDLEIGMEDVAEAVKKSFDLSYSAYLGKKFGNSISWLFSLSAYADGKVIKSFDKSFYKKIQEDYYSRKGKYFITKLNRAIPPKKLILARNKSAKKIALDAMKRNCSQINTQTVLIIDAPEINNGNWNICNSCPDAMIHNNRLVPSCLLERIKGGENIEIN